MPSKFTVGVILTPELLRLTRAAAERESLSISSVIRRALKSYFFGQEVAHSNKKSDTMPPTESGEKVHVA